MGILGVGIGKVPLDGRDGLWGGFNNDSGAPEGTPALQGDEAIEPSCVVGWSGEGNQAAALGVGECGH